VIDNSVTSIGDNAFQGSTITSLTIPRTVTSIGFAAFASTQSLQTVTMADSVRTLGQYVFDFSSLTSIRLSRSLTSIPNFAFYRAEQLLNLDIPNGVTTIGQFAVTYATKLISINLPNSITSIDSTSFIQNPALQQINIPNKLTSIPSSAFSGNTSLKSISIPSTVTSLGDDVFYGDIGLKNISIPNTVTSIGMNCLIGCTYFDPSVNTAFRPNVTIHVKVGKTYNYAFLQNTDLDYGSLQGPSITSGQLPTGLQLSEPTLAAQVISGTPSGSGVFHPVFFETYSGVTPITISGFTFVVDGVNCK
jgi:hypothetical protein